MSEPSIAVQWASADFNKSDQGYRVKLAVALGSNLDQQCMADMQRHLSAGLGALLGIQISRVGLQLLGRGPDGDLAGLVFVAPASVFSIAPPAFRQAVTDALNQSMETALQQHQQHTDDDDARMGWLAAVRGAH